MTFELPRFTRHLMGHHLVSVRPKFGPFIGQSLWDFLRRFFPALLRRLAEF